MRLRKSAANAEPLRLTGHPAAEARDRARHWLGEFGVREELWRAYPSTFSGGEQQKVNLARGKEEIVWLRLA
jgi:alpha-D-ribose 1-methylphosphonate 5-triphosphate synthase subunit PhnL